MSGHSHFKTVAATKNANDAKKGKIFSKMARVITIAVKENGPDVSSNVQLKACAGGDVRQAMYRDWETDRKSVV